MPELINTKQILRELLRKTETGEIRWRLKSNSASNYKTIFIYRKKITSKKYLSFILNVKLSREKSDLTILYGEKENEKLISIILSSKQRLVSELAQDLIERFNRGDIHYMYESWGNLKLRNDKSEPPINTPLEEGDIVYVPNEYCPIGYKKEGENYQKATVKRIMYTPESGFPRGTLVLSLHDKDALRNNFNLYISPRQYDVLKTAENTKNETENSSIIKMKNIKFIKKLLKDTLEGKLYWEDNYFDETDAVFISVFSMTKNKSLLFNIRTSTKKIVDNELKVFFKTKEKNTTVINKITLKNYPILIELFEYLNKKLLNRVYTSPIENKSVVVQANTLEEYKEIILKEIKSIIKTFPLNKKSEDFLEELYELFNKCKKSNSIDDIGKILYKIKQLEEEAKKYEYRENYL